MMTSPTLLLNTIAALLTLTYDRQLERDLSRSTTQMLWSQGSKRFAGAFEAAQGALRMEMR